MYTILFQGKKRAFIIEQSYLIIYIQKQKSENIQ